MAPSPWRDYQCTEPKGPDKKQDKIVPSNSPVSPSTNENRMLNDKDAPVCDKESDDLETAQLKPQVTALDENEFKKLLEEAMDFRLPKDVEGKSPLFKNLLEEVTSKKSSRTVATVMPKSSVSNKSSKKHKMRRNHAPSEEISNQTKVKNEQKNVIRCPFNVKCLDSLEENIKEQTGTLESEMNCQDNNGEPLIEGSTDDQVKSRKVTRVEDIVKRGTIRDIAKIVTLPARKIISNDENNSKGFAKIPDTIKKPPNFEKISKKIDPKDIDRVKAFNKNNGIPIKEIYIPREMDEPEKGTDDQMKRDFSIVESLIEVDKSYDTHDRSRCSNTTVENGIEFLKDVANVDEPFVKIKKIDENGNALNPSKMDDGRKAKPRRIKAKNDKNTIMSQNIEGYRGDSDIEAVIQYIESTNKGNSKQQKSNGSLSFHKQGRVPNKLRSVRDKSSEGDNRKGKKPKDNQFHKSNSLEEVSASKLEDLTSDVPKTLQTHELSSETSFKRDATRKNEKSADRRTSSVSSKSRDTREKRNSSDSRKDRYDNECTGDLEFHIVTKKHRKKKKSQSQEVTHNMKNTGVVTKAVRRFNEGVRSRKDINYKNPRCQGESRGRKPASSVPPSDKSADSSDLDSVHSLPVSSSAAVLESKAVEEPLSLTSYADIARSVTGPLVGSAPTLSKPASTVDPPSLSKVQCVSSEEIPTVVLPIPKSRRVPPSSPIVNIDKEYPPLKKSDGRKKSNDLFVEFSVQLPKQVPVPEKENFDVALSVKLPHEQKSVSESTTMSISVENPNKRPAVILMNEKTVEASAANELVFGFEVNQQLLRGNNAENSGDELKEEVNLPATVDHKKVVDSSETVKNRSAQFNYYDIVEYISGEWFSVQEELKRSQNDGKVVYFQP